MDQQQPYLIEACVETLDQAIEAEKLGAQRLELCARLDLGGTTPSPELITQTLESVSIPVRVMVRPRGGDFVHSAREIQEMLQSIETCKELGVREIVMGVLTSQRKVNVEAMKTLAEAARPMTVTFHKAIDRTADILEAIEDLRPIRRIRSILSSGGAATAMEGSEMLLRMLRACRDRFDLVVAGKVTPDNLPELHERIGAREYHGRNIVRW